MMKNSIIYILILLTSMLWLSCKEEGRIDFIDDAAAAPGQVTNVTVDNRPGGAVLRYTLPVDRNMLYVRAEYEIKSGVIRETKSSYFKDSLVLEGFGIPDTYDVKLYSVGKNEKESAPYTVQINPTTAPVQLASKKFRDTFGGVAIDFENPEEANLAIVLMADTANLGYMSELITYYTSTPKGTFTYRGVDGLDPVEQEFSMYIRDRWGNLSDTITAEVTPWFEEYIPKATWNAYTLPSDIPPVNTGYPTTKIWDDVYTGSGFHGMETQVLPHNITWDLGRTVKLSRLKYWPREHADDRWKRGHAKVFEIWGSVSPNPTGELDDSWIPLGRFESLKPSGPGPQITQEDIAFADEGIEFEFAVSDFAPDPFTPIRYIRFRTVSTYANASFSTVHVLELSFWGELID
ncbi:DUF4959 domain-containing protein [Parapedobacter sp. 10938]|uniref:DUF4959 domain-containing protein n=1 Tax=Parapedobacter flavus TaxID=3110225 RepID=UPI002DBC2D21|nr:DUF4959 domain-containing protein [Parapedobacter sp. 10938]MEC3880461.1 DUF4959 domain-containing protein [Parapedobacter sp. 10938]